MRLLLISIFVTICSAQTLTVTVTNTGKSGPPGARVWNYTVTNTGPDTTNAVQITSFTLIQSGGPICTPVVGTSSVNGGMAQGFPVQLGDISPFGSVLVDITLDFSSCLVGARFSVMIELSFTVLASRPKYNQFP